MADILSVCLWLSFFLLQAAAVTGVIKQEVKKVMPKKKKKDESVMNVLENEEMEEEDAEDEESLEAEEGEEEESGTPPEEKDKQPVDIETLQSKIQEFEHSNKGLRDAITSIRAEKQALAAKLEQITDTLAAIQAMRQEGAAGGQQPANGSAGQALTQKGIKVEVTEDGEIYIPPEEITNLFKQQTKPIHDTVAMATQSVEQLRQQSELQSAVNNVLQKDDAFAPSYNALMSMFKEVSREAVNRAVEKGLDPKAVADADVAAELLYDTPIEKSLQEKGLSLDDLVALDKSSNVRVFAKRLERVLGKMTKGASQGGQKAAGQGGSENLNKIASKQNNLTGVKSAPPPSEGTTLDNMANTLNAMDLLNMPDDKFNKLLKAAEG